MVLVNVVIFQLVAYIWPPVAPSFAAVFIVVIIMLLFMLDSMK